MKQFIKKGSILIFTRFFFFEKYPSDYKIKNIGCIIVSIKSIIKNTDKIVKIYSAYLLYKYFKIKYNIFQKF